MGTGVVGGGIKGGCSGPLRLISALRALRTSLLEQLLLQAQSNAYFYKHFKKSIGQKTQLLTFMQAILTTMVVR